MSFVAVINGPNLNLLGRRQPEIYGPDTLGSITDELVGMFPDLDLRFFQSNHEGELVDEIQRKGYDPECRGIVLNAGAYTHTSLAIADAIAAVPVDVVEVHLSNIYARDTIRRTSLIAPVCKGCISGFGKKSYRLAIEALIDQYPT